MKLNFINSDSMWKLMTELGTVIVILSRESCTSPEIHNAKKGLISTDNSLSWAS